MIPAFEIADVVASDNTSLAIVDGRALIWIRVGMVLYLEGTNTVVEKGEFQVISIEAYYKQLREIGPTWTCRLQLQGDRLELLSRARHLLTEE